MDSLCRLCWRTGKHRKRSQLMKGNLPLYAADFLYIYRFAFLGDLMYPFIKFFNLFIPSYGLCVCTAVFLCAVLVFNKARKNNINTDNLMVLVAISIGCAMLGGVFLYIVVSYDFATICKQIATGELLFLKSPGIVFYGALLGGIAGGIAALKILKLPTQAVEACVVPYIPLGHAVGRVGCLLAGCCYGLPYNGVFAVSTIFDKSGSTHFPIQAAEALFNLLIMKILLLYEKKTRMKYSILAMYFALYSFLRFCLEFFRGDLIRGKLLFFSTSQWISVAVFLISLVVMGKNLKKCEQKESQ